MLEFLSLCLAPVNLLFTVMLVGVLFYWALFLSGTVGLDLFDGDLDLDLDAEVDLNVDMGADMGAEPGAELDGDAGIDTSAEGGGRSAGVVFSLLRLIGVGDVPVMVLLSAIIGSLWAVSIISSHYFNPELRWFPALLVFVPNLLLAIVLTRIVTWPASYLFQKSNVGVAKPAKIVGRPCTVTTSSVSEAFGQAQFELENTPVTLNVRCPEGQTLRKGDEAVILEYLEDKNVYIIVPFDLEVR